MFEIPVIQLIKRVCFSFLQLLEPVELPRETSFHVVAFLESRRHDVPHVYLNSCVAVAVS